MIGVDTNVLVRVLVRDNAAQTDAAVGFLGKRSAEDPAFVSSVVLAELAWVLEQAYAFDDVAIHQAFDWLFESANVAVEREETMQAAIALAKEAKADVSDCIIMAIAADGGAPFTVTFDRPAAKRILGMELLK